MYLKINGPQELSDIVLASMRVARSRAPVLVQLQTVFFCLPCYESRAGGRILLILVSLVLAEVFESANHAFQRPPRGSRSVFENPVSILLAVVVTLVKFPGAHLIHGTSVCWPRS